MASRRRGITYEEHIEEVKRKIAEKPQVALREIGKFLVKQIKKEAAKSRHTRTYYENGRKIKVKPGRLRKSIGYKFFKKEGRVDVGSKSWYAIWEEKGSSKNTARPFLMPTVRRNVNVIQDMIKDAMRALGGD